jgi:protoporphyrinogen oxidase
MGRWSVAIIGGGPGGLLTAYQLQKRAPVPYVATLYEASGRLGGKILTNRFALAPVPYESGAAELYDYSVVDEDPLRELIAELGLSTQPMSGATVILDNRILASNEDIYEQLGPPGWSALEQFDRTAKDWMSPQEFYRSDWKDGDTNGEGQASFEMLLATIPDDAARRYVQTMVHSDLATEPHLTNAAYGLQNYLMNDPAYMRLYTIDGGIERLPQELARRLEATVRLHEPVVRVEKTAGPRLRVNSRRAGQVVAEDFDFVVVALPNHLLPTIAWGGDRLAAAMRRHHAHYDHPAHYLRISILFDKPFWRDYIQESYFMLDAFGGCCLYDESSRNGCTGHGVLGWLLGGEPALSLSDRTDEELIRLMQDALPSFLEHGRRYFVEGRVHRWVGAVNGLPAGFPAHDLDTRHVPEPVEHANLLVVGDYLFDSTLNGVLDSADFVAEWLAAEMEPKRLP